jgi:hypothetical protein
VGVCAIVMAIWQFGMILSLTNNVSPYSRMLSL